jgi:type VI secretion system protein ImpL
MLGRLKGVLVVVAGLLLVAVIIWWGWPILDITVAGEPRDSVLVRGVLIAVAIGGWIGYRVFKWLKAARVSETLMAAVAKSSGPKEQASAEALKLRQQFEEAVAALGQNRRRGQTLYELPWYVIIGAPGAGKTTALANSGLQFPIKQRGQALRGVGGTRNCDWWFTNEAVFLDTAGRYTTQDSDPGSDGAAWGEFLTLLKKYRQRRPLNGVIVAMSAFDLMTQGQAARDEHVAAVRRRIEELNERLGIRLPVYLLVTKCDLIAGFSEYFDDLTVDGRAQVWGVTFPAERVANAEAAEAYPGELDALILRLNERLLDRVEAERDPARRVKAFGFPQQMASLREPLTGFVTEVFASTRFERAIQLRGVYFTSGTQEGTPVDRLLGALGRRFGMAPSSVAPGTRGKAYFIERLLKDVVVPESGLAGVNRRLELRKGAAQLGAYVAMAACAVLVIVLLFAKYSASVNYLSMVEQALRVVQEVPPVAADAPRDRIVRRLDTVRALHDVASQQNQSWLRRWALYSYGSTSEAAELAYVGKVNDLVVPRVKAGLERRIGSAAPPEELYEGLLAYLPLGETYRQYFEKGFYASKSWDEPGGGEALSQHLEWLLDRPDALRYVELNDQLVRQARNEMRNAPPEQLVFREIERLYQGDARVVRLSDSGIGVERVLSRKSNRPLNEPLPALYTKPVFKEITDEQSGALKRIVASYAARKWVWGEQGPPDWSVDAITAKVLDLYEDKYIEHWVAIRDDIRGLSLPGLTSFKNGLDLLAADKSPLKGVLVFITEHTKLVEPGKPEAKSPLEGFREKGEKLLGLSGKTVPPGTRVTEHFDPVHRAVAEIEPALGILKQLKAKLAASGEGPGRQPPTPAIQAETQDLAKALETSAEGLPSLVKDIAKQVSGNAQSAVGRGAAASFQEIYGSAVLQACAAHVPGKYPFVKASPTSIALVDFGDLFGYGGVFDRFEEDHLKNYTDPSRTRWISGSPVRDPFILSQFQMARRIREAFFDQGRNRVELRFDVQVLQTDLKLQDRNEPLFTLDVHGASIKYDGIDRDPTGVRWPGSKLFASATWRGPVVLAPDVQDAWAWFRLVERGDLRPAGQESRWQLTLMSGGHRADIAIDAQKKDNAFGAIRDVIRGFRCGSPAT